MRIAVIGATGNAGTAVLRALQRRSEVTHVLGIARRLPDHTVEPYDSAEWASIDIAAATACDEAIAELTENLRNYDAVIHLAWLIQPNNRRELLHRVNVEGTRRVAEAVAAAGVPHLIVASSVGSYSPDNARTTAGDLPLRDESFPTDGINSSHYSSDKADQEDVLDAFEAAHPEIAVTRLRPALIFQRDAASEIQRYFIGSAVPGRKLRPGALPSLLLPKGLHIQVIHSDDAGEAYAAAAVTGRGGAFNICADDILSPRDLATILTGSDSVAEAPAALVRAAMVTAHATGAVPADAGWLDMAMGVPMMDNSRAKRELGWTPRHGAADTVREILDGMADGAGHSSPPLQPRDAGQRNVQAIHENAEEGANAGTGTSAPKPLPETIGRDLLELYLSDHLTGATAGVNRISRMAADFIDTPVYGLLGQMAEQITAERDFLAQLINDLGMQRKPYRQAVAWVGERVGRLKLNKRAVERSPMTLLLEADLMRGAVQAKMGGWEALLSHAEDLGLDPGVFEQLIDDAKQQLKNLEEVHAYAAPRAFTEDGTTDR